MSERLSVMKDREMSDKIVPMTAIRTLEVAGGTPLEQAIPEDYALAAIVFRALEERDGRDLSFILKAYLPVRVLVVPDSDLTVLMETLGLVSNTIPTPKVPDVALLVTKLSSLRDPRTAIQFLEDAMQQLNRFDLEPEVTVAGVLSGQLSTATANLIRWPCKKDVEPYAILLQPSLRSGAADKILDVVQACRSAIDTGPILKTMLFQVESKVASIIERAPSLVQNLIAKLDERIVRLERDIEYLESRLQTVSGSTADELSQRLQSRRKALLHDKDRRAEILSSTQDISARLQDLLEAFKDRVYKLMEQIQALENRVSSFFITQVTETASDALTLMIPLTIVGFSRKGVLEVKVIPPLRFKGTEQKVGRRRDFVNPFTLASPAFDELGKLIEARIDDDVALMKFIRDSAETGNILSVKFTRHLLKEGAELLRADGIVSKSALKQLDQFLSKFPERHLAITDTTIVSGSRSSCQVTFHITDNQGKPIPNASLTLGPVSARSDATGTIKLSLAMSSYSGTVSAENFMERPVELNLRTPGEFMVPILMQPLSTEELLAKSIDSLEKRAERIALIRQRLSAAFEQHGETFLNVPAFRSALVDLLQEMGYDPESWISQAQRERGMIRRFLKGEVKADDLKRIILRLGEDASDTGGVMRFSELIVRLDKQGWHTTTREVEEVVQSMVKEGLIKGISLLDDGAKVVEFVPVALTHDPQEVLALAAKNGGQLTIEDIVVGLGWTARRAKTVLDLLVNNGVAKEQRRYSRTTRYWFPGLRKKK